MLRALKFRSTRGRDSKHRITRRSRRRLFHETLENRRLLSATAIKDPGTPYVDADNNGLYDEFSGDVLLLSGELDDGFFDTAIAEGPSYTEPIPGAGLGIHGAAITAVNLDFSADGQVIVNTNLTATSGNLLLTSREGDVSLDDPTLQAKNLLQITSEEGDITSQDDHLLATGASSVIRLDAGGDILLEGTRVEAKKDVEMIAGDEITLVPSGLNLTTVTATPNTVGKVDLNAPLILVASAQIDARQDIVMEAVELSVVESQLTANGTGLAKIDLHGGEFVDVSGSEIIARKAIEIEAYSVDGELVGIDALIDAVGGGSTTVDLVSHGSVDLDGATVRAKERVSIEALHGSVNINDATLEADSHSAGTVSVVAIGIIDPEAPIFLQGNLEAYRAEVRARRDVIIDVTGSIDSDSFNIEATGAQIGSIDIDAGQHINLEAAVLQAGVEIDINAGIGLHANFAQILACGRASSQVRMTAGFEINLIFATVRANHLIDLFSGEILDLVFSSLGISRAGVGDILLEGKIVLVEDAEIKAPDNLVLLGVIDGMPADISPGTLPCELAETPPTDPG